MDPEGNLKKFRVISGELGMIVDVRMEKGVS
jgi:hypothetical protein